MASKGREKKGSVGGPWCRSLGKASSVRPAVPSQEGPERPGEKLTHSQARGHRRTAGVEKACPSHHASHSRLLERAGCPWPHTGPCRGAGGEGVWSSTDTSGISSASQALPRDGLQMRKHRPRPPGLEVHF